MPRGRRKDLEREILRPDIVTRSREQDMHWLPRRSVYFAQMGAAGPIKIGMAREPAKRIDTIQSGNPYPLTVLLTVAPAWTSTRDLERRLHHLFSNNRMRGEWFESTADLIWTIEMLESNCEQEPR